MSRPDADDPRWAWKEYADELQAELERTRLQRDLAVGITDEHLTTILELQAENAKHLAWLNRIYEGARWGDLREYLESVNGLAVKDE
jgi:hypothetical protein